MAGRIKRGEGTLIGNAGEFYVAAELLKRGVITALAPRNAPSFDILAARGPRTIRVRVKTKSAEYEDWQWAIKKDGAIFRDLQRRADYTVLVDLTPETKDLRFFVVPTFRVNAWLVKDFESWLRTPGKNGRKHDAANKKRHLKYPRFAKKLSPYLHDWDRMWA